jgi:predicted XRE-type DNA-binding protein
MTEELLEIIAGSGNIYRDFGYPDADIRQAKALMGSAIIKVLDAEGLSTRQAAAKTGIPHSEFSRIRNAKFSRFTIDRLLAMLAKLDQAVDISLNVHPRQKILTDVDALPASL